MNVLAGNTTPFISDLAAHQSESSPDTDALLEQQMVERGLSSETKRFLRHLHQAEKQLNDAFEKAHRGGALEQCVSEVYRNLYCSDETLPPAG